MIFATINAAGADITEAARRCPAISGMLLSHVTYSAITLPATVENPPTITVINSEFVILEMYGLIKIGASVCPTKIFAEILPNIFSKCSEYGFNLKIYQHCLPDQSEKLKNFYEKKLILPH